MPRRVIVTGGTGFIGREVCSQLLDSGYEVIVLSRRPGKTSGRPGDGVTVSGWDGRSADGWAQYADGAYGIVNLAGAGIAEKRWNAAVKDRILTSRLAAGVAVAEAVARAAVKPRVLVQASAVGYYGSRGDDELTESAGPGDGFLADVARRWEASTADVEELGVRRVIIRTAPVIGTGGGFLPRMAAPFRFFAGGPMGSGGQWMSWIHLFDEAAAIRFLLEHDGLEGPFNLTAPEPARNGDFSSSLGRALGRPSWLPVPGFALRLVLGEMSGELILTSQRTLPARLLEAGFRFRFPDPATALSDIFGRSGK